MEGEISSNQEAAHIIVTLLPDYGYQLLSGLAEGCSEDMV
jgi:hypothetical protein